MEVLELLEYVNNGLLEGKSVIAIGKELGLNESAIRKKLNRNGYKRDGNKFVLKDNITSNIIGYTKDKEINNYNDKKRNVKEIKASKRKELEDLKRRLENNSCKNDIESKSDTPFLEIKPKREKVKLDIDVKEIKKTIKDNEHKELEDFNRRLKNDNITSNITPVKVIKEEIAPLPNIDMDKLNLLLDNLENLLKLIPSNIEGGTSFRSGINDVRTFRIDSGLYEEVKKRAAQNNINIADILNKSIEDYLNNYL